MYIYYIFLIKKIKKPKGYSNMDFKAIYSKKNIFAKNESYIIIFE